MWNEIHFKLVILLRKEGILFNFNIRFDITYVLDRLSVRNDVHWLCTSELLLKQHVLLPVGFNNFSLRELH